MFLLALASCWCAATELPIENQKFKFEITEADPANPAAVVPAEWSSHFWIADANSDDSYVYYAGDLYQADGTPTTFDLKLGLTGLNGNLIAAVNEIPINPAVEAVLLPNLDPAIAAFPVSADKICSISFKLTGLAENPETTTVHFVPMDMVADTDRSGTIDRGLDNPKKAEWTKELGAIYAVNFDRDGMKTSGLENRPDAIHFTDAGDSSDEDWKIESTEDEDDIAPLVIAPLTSLPDDYTVFLVVEEVEDFRAIHLFPKIEDQKEAIWGSHKDPSAAADPPPWAATDSDPDDNMIEITKFVNPNHPDFGMPEYETGMTSNGDHELGIEGLLLRGMTVEGGTLEDATGNTEHSGKFSGEIQFSLRILDEMDQVVAEDVSLVRLRVAPWLMISRDEPSEEIWTADLGPENEPFRDALLDGHYAGLGHSGQLQVATSPHRWFQDHLEIGFTQRPGGPKVHVVFRVPYDRPVAGWTQPSWPLKHLLKEEVGIFQIGVAGGGAGPHARSGDYGGNLEVLTPNNSHPLGLALMGNNASDTMQAFLEAQEFQHEAGASFSARSDWLIVGHIDEYTSFLSGGRILISAARQALEMLEADIPAADRPTRVFFATNGTTRTGAVTVDMETTDDPLTPLDERRLIRTGINHVTNRDDFLWIRFYEGDAKGHIAKIALHDGFVEVENEVLNVPSIWFLGENMQEYQHQSERGALEGTWRFNPAAGDEFVLCEGTKRWSPFEQDIDTDGDGVADAFDIPVSGFPALVTVEEILNDAGPDNFVQFNKFDVQGAINTGGESAIRSAAGSAAPRFIPVPSLFFGRDLPSGTDVAGPNPVSGAGGSVAFSPGPTNLQPVVGSLYVPRQFGPRNAAGEDIYEMAIKNSILEPVFFVDCWDSYHRSLGETHCASNVKRGLPAWNWWERISP